MIKNSIYSCLWCPNNAIEMAHYYVDVFTNAKILSENPMVVKIEINNTIFMLLNGAESPFSVANSYVIECDTQEEIDHYWNKLGYKGQYKNCGWLEDQFGVSWQIVPKILGELMNDQTKSNRVIEAFLKMQKFDIQQLIDA
ncbi:VOC family protein [Flavobacterium branchiophilum]|uniref:Putative 3-demethylubiquinone-9 3-O-methyltransferase n=1 Tax=Flavobacterium branchiophilum (strain FL-15) TaxID=1034807 RepID=G2Z127_FLABF|nr:VOC family protein [Flavobacterium branchiophilum]CCB69586.1 Putative 3-demethylubiquinone-9 3-O-methyltransferase [Flavobacterium branchiophilum FL-15]